MGKDVHNKPSKEVLHALRGASEHERILHRLHSVVLVLNGLSCSEAARLYGDSARSVAYWLQRFEEGGLSGLEEEQRSGRPSKLTSAQTKRIRWFVEKQTQAGETVTAKSVSFFINQKFGVKLTVRQCRRILKQMASECDGVSGEVADEY